MGRFAVVKYIRIKFLKVRVGKNNYITVKVGGLSILTAGRVGEKVGDVLLFAEGRRGKGRHSLRITGNYGIAGNYVTILSRVCRFPFELI